MKISKRQLKRIIKEEKQKLLNEATMGFSGTGFGQQSKKTMNKSASFFGGASVIEEQSPPGQVISAAEKGLAAIMLDKIVRGDGALEDEIYQYMYDIGFEDFEIQAALDQLADRYNLR